MKIFKKQRKSLKDFRGDKKTPESFLIFSNPHYKRHNFGK